MKPFQGVVRGRGKYPVTQLGDSKSGMTVECNAITTGITVEAGLASNGSVVMYVFITGGSTGPKRRILVKTIIDGRSVDGSED